jgi:hypothetical protein
VRKSDDLTIFSAGALTYRNPLGHLGLSRDTFTFTFTFYVLVVSERRIKFIKIFYQCLESNPEHPLAHLAA